MWRCATSRGGCAPVSSACSSTRVAAPASTVCAVPFLPRTGHGVPHNSALSFASNSRLSCLASGSSAVEAATAEATSPQEQPEPAVAAEDWAAEIEETLKLVRLLPPSVRDTLEGHPRLGELLEVVMDLGRPPLARFPGSEERLAPAPVVQADLDVAVAQVGSFGGDNRAGIDATLHRIAALRNRAGRIVGLTCRVGRAVRGSADLVADLVSGGASVLFLGRPGVGKTTAIRELSRTMAGDLRRRVVIVDTSNEIGGDGDVAHAGIGRARRMQVPDPEQQHRVMIEAVENHMPQVVVIDEIGTEAEAAAARTIAQRGVQLVATAHGNELANLVKNPALADLVGGIQSVTLGDDEAKRRGVQKSILERAAPPTFDVAVEMLSRERWHVYADVGAAVDALLAGGTPGGQLRERAPDGTIKRYTAAQRSGGQASAGAGGAGGGEPPGSGGRVLPELRRVSSSTAAGPSLGEQDELLGSGSGGGFVRPRLLFGSEGDASAPEGATLTRRGRTVRLGAASPEGALLRLHVSELDEERLWEVMAAMELQDKVYLAPRPAEADAVLAVRSRLRANAGLRAAARAAGVPVYAVKSSSAANLVRAFRTLLGLEPSPSGVFGSRGSMDDEPGGGALSPADSLDESPRADGDEAAAPGSSAIGGTARALAEEESGLTEAQLAAEQIVLPLGQPVELLPRAERVRRAQAALCGRIGVSWELVGEGSNARLRLLPGVAPRTQPGESAAVAAAADVGAGDA